METSPRPAQAARVAAAPPLTIPYEFDDPWAGYPISAAIKRGMDFLGALVLMTVTAPLLLLAALLVRLTSHGSVFFAQRRIGHRCAEFGMFKLRTMVADAESLEESLSEANTGQTFLKITDDPRCTPVGRWLRRLSIDELPQLVNVLKGDMSLVGPRPLLVCDYGKLGHQQQMRRFAVKPGLTGLWQVSGRSRCSDERRLALDIEYVERMSLLLDLEILLRTVPVVLSTKGAY